MIRPSKVIVSLAAGVCAFAVCNARAVSSITPLTNFVTFSAVTEGQGASTSVGGTNTVFAKAVKQTHNTAALISELGSATGHTNATAFSKAAKLVYIEGGTGANGFAVIDGATFVSVSNIMSLNTQISTNKWRSGTQSDITGLAFKTTTDSSIVELDYDDTAVGGTLAFFIRGVGTGTTTDTSPVSGTYTETFSAKLTGAGSGVSIGVPLDDPFIITGTVSLSGSGELTLPPPS